MHARALSRCLVRNAAQSERRQRRDHDSSRLFAVGALLVERGLDAHWVAVKPVSFAQTCAGLFIQGLTASFSRRCLVRTQIDAVR